MNLIKRFNGAEKYTKYSILIIILFSLVVLSLASIYHVSGDGCWHIPVGKFIANNQKIPLFEPLGRDEPFWNPPLYHLIVALVYYIFSHFSHSAANFAVKFISPAFGILSLVFSFLIIKKLINSKIAFYSTLFLAFIPIFIDYSILSYVESTVTFFAVLSVYFLVNGRFVLAGVSAGLAMLTKYNGAFILPVLIYILYKKFDRKVFLKNALIIAVLPLLVALPWFIRNWLLLGNPVWPFLNFIFGGLHAKSYAALDLGRLVHYNLLLTAYFGIFGVPDGNYSLFSFLDIPYFGFLLAAWLVGTIIFISPLLSGFFTERRNDEKGIFAVWVASYLALFSVYVANVGWAVSRMMLPAFPALAVFWAFGVDKLHNKNAKMFMVLLAAVAAGFVFAGYVKFSAASAQWGVYKGDFNWVKENTDENAVFIANGQCVPYNIERKSFYASEENARGADYIWVNQDFALDRVSALDENTLRSIRSKNYRIAYYNRETGTTIYKISGTA